MTPANNRSPKRTTATAPAPRPSRRDVLKGAAAAGVALGGGIPGIVQARPAPAAGGPVTLNVLLWEHWKVAEGLQKNDPTNVPKRRLWFYETIKQFEADHKDIKLQYQTANWNVATQTFIAASQAGNPPDVLGAQSQDNQPLANAGLVGDLDQFRSRVGRLQPARAARGVLGGRQDHRDAGLSHVNRARVTTRRSSRRLASPSRRRRGTTSSGWGSSSPRTRAAPAARTSGASAAS